MQPEGYHHDYSAIETRLRQLEAPAYRQRLIGRSILILAMAAAICALVLTAAHAWRLVMEREQVEKIGERIVSMPAVSPQFPDIPDAAAETPGIVTTNFTLFRETEVELGDRVYEVTTGHKYFSETDTTYAHAWCYTEQFVDGVEIRVSLGSLAPGKAPEIRPASSQTLMQTGLSTVDHAALFDSCPWLEGNPNVDNAKPFTENGSKA